MRFITTFIAISALIATTMATASDKVKVEVTHAVTCTRKTKKGDEIEVCILRKPSGFCFC